MKEWHFNILFFVGVGSALFMLIAPTFGVKIEQHATALTSISAILTYVLTQKPRIVSKKDKDSDDETDSEDKEVEDHESR